MGLQVVRFADSRIIGIAGLTLSFQIANFKKGIRTSLDNLLRGEWKADAELTYVGKRRASLGKRNDVVKITYKDEFSVEFDLSFNDGLPQKAISTNEQTPTAKRSPKKTATPSSSRSKASGPPLSSTALQTANPLRGSTTNR